MRRRSNWSFSPASRPCRRLSQLPGLMNDGAGQRELELVGPLGALGDLVGHLVRLEVDGADLAAHPVVEVLAGELAAGGSRRSPARSRSAGRGWRAPCGRCRAGSGAAMSCASICSSSVSASAAWNCQSSMPALVARPGVAIERRLLVQDRGADAQRPAPRRRRRRRCCPRPPPPGSSAAGRRCPRTPSAHSLGGSRPRPPRAWLAAWRIIAVASSSQRRASRRRSCTAGCA